MKIRSIPVMLLASICLFQAYGQETFPRNDVKDERIEAFAFTNAIIYTDAENQLAGATLLIRDGKIEQVGQSIDIPAGYQVRDLDGKYIYPGLIDIYTNYGMPEVKRPGRSGWTSREQIDPTTKGPYSANDAIKSHFMAVEEFTIDEKEAEAFRKLGFGTVLSFRPDGIARGTGAVVTLGDGSENKHIIKDQATAHYSFNRGSSTQYYPRSMMGYISLLRQTYLDAEWYNELDEKPFKDVSLESWIASQSLPQIFDARNWMNTLRADKVGDEFGVQYVIKSGGNEYQRIAEVKGTNASLIIPVSFPDAYDVEDPIDADRVAYEDMLHWELAPTNPAVLSENGVTFALTTSGLKKKEHFFANVRKAIEFGLDETVALKSLTTIPASLLQIEDQVGTIAQGKIANFIITDRPLFDHGLTIHENWIQGKGYVITRESEPDHAGTYTLQLDGADYVMKISGEGNAQKVKLVLNDTSELNIGVQFEQPLVSFQVKLSKDDAPHRLSGWSTEDGWRGTGQTPDGAWFDWEASMVEEEEMASKDDESEDEEDTRDVGNVVYPFLAYGIEELPEQKTFLIKNTTVWTNEEQGILENTDVLISNGKISQIGKDLSASGAEIIDGSGKHLTPGIVDEHTHIAGGGNEVATNSAMVRIGDQVTSEDINIYRSLAGGVTTAQVLHGSANPIGGQSAIIKLKWGENPEGLQIPGADGFIKFALGENVKRSRNSNSIRYPQTRMGVEQVYVDAFTNAREYEKAWANYNAFTPDEKEDHALPRRDLADEAILEILNEERFITCHSYVQSEINMLMKVADQFDFRINTFTHILEGYKVADKMKEHGVAASTFSDWWNYKWEVRYAIPYNAAIMHREGVLTGINSDDANMGRRLNQEAAKAIKYGGISEEEALKMVTLNPAIMLHLDDRIGSVKVGKDADLVLWTDHPLSVYARAEKTLIEGAVYFDLEEDQERRNELQVERNRLVQKMLDAKKSGKRTQKAKSREYLEVHCESVLGEENHSHH